MKAEKKLNYQQKQELIIKEIEKKIPYTKPTLLLHACCAPCSSYVLELLSRHFNITIFYYNPNIHPAAEYNRRLNELKNFLLQFPEAVKNSVTLVEAPYDPKDYFEATNAQNEPQLAVEPEKGERCRRCYELRMKAAYEYAVQNNFDYFTTTLSISPHKDAEKINFIGYTLNKVNSTKYLPSDFKKNNGFKRSLELSKEFNLYRQDYCGCIYSKQNG